MKPYNPLAPTRPKALRRQARADVMAQFAPLLAEINRQFGARSSAGQASILSNTNALAAQLAPLAGQTHDIYAQAQGSQSALDTALANRLTGAGASVGGEIGAKLAAAGLGGVPNEAASVGAGAAGAGFASGSADLARLIAQGAGAESYAAQLPGFARMRGAQAGHELGAQLESERAQAAGDLRSKIPGTLASVLQDLRNLEFQKAATNLGFQGDIYSQNAQTQRTQIQQSNANARNIRSTQAANQRSGMNVAERARHNKISEAQQRKRDQTAAKQRRRQQWWREHSGGKKKGGGPPSMNR
jgi:hypothetical protein